MDNWVQVYGAEGMSVYGPQIVSISSCYNVTEYEGLGRRSKPNRKDGTDWQCVSLTSLPSEVLPRHLTKPVGNLLWMMGVVRNSLREWNSLGAPQTPHGRPYTLPKH